MESEKFKSLNFTQRTNFSFYFTNYQPQIVKIFKNFQTNNGFFVEILIKICNVLVIGIQYYPILLCVEFKKKCAFNYFLCTCYIWALFGYYLVTISFCQDYHNYHVFDNLKNLIRDLAGDRKNFSFEQNITIDENTYLNRALYENFLFFFVILLISLILTLNTLILTLKKFSILSPYLKNWTFLNQICENEFENELNYTKNLFRLKHNVQVSFLRNLFERYVYKNCKHYRFSKQHLGTIIIICMLFVVKTTIIIKASKNLNEILIQIFEFFILKLSSILSETDFIKNKQQKFIENLYKANETLFNFMFNIIYTSALLTFVLCLTQVLLGLKSYQEKILNAYKGLYIAIPSPNEISNVKIISSSLHFCSYSIGYAIWGYVSSFLIISIFYTVFRLIISDSRIQIISASLLLPLITILIFKRMLIWYTTVFFLAGKNGLKNKKFYLLLNHFNFFFDCFLMSFVCFMRIIWSCLAAILFMTRLDYSMYCRNLERKDSGYMSYVSFIHMEVSLTHPVKLAFCELLNRQSHDNRVDIRKLRIRNKWHVLYTLIKNPSLRKSRKSQMVLYKAKAESFINFIKRKLRKSRISFGQIKN